jgi:Protein of Unknown function (DUF2784)
MPWSLLADAVVVLHLAFIVFVVIGGFLALRWRWLVLLHIPTLAWATWVEVSGAICPLTPFENHLRRLAGEAGYEGGFIAHYITPVMYPAGLTRDVQFVLAGMLIALNVAAYTLLTRRIRRFR